jgi:hypothetical protein
MNGITLRDGKGQGERTPSRLIAGSVQELRLWP